MAFSYLVCFFYLIPLWLLWAAWANAFKSKHAVSLSRWRALCFGGALIVASIAALTSIASILLWLHVGGDPHGMGAPPGPWRFFGRIGYCSIATTLVLGAFGKGKSRLLVYGSAITLFLVEMFVAMSDME